MPDGIVEAWQDGGRVFGTYSGGPRVELVPVPPDDGPVRTFVVAPQRALTAEEADAYTELLGKLGSPKPPATACEGCKGMTDSTDSPFCEECVARVARRNPSRDWFAYVQDNWSGLDDLKLEALKARLRERQAKQEATTRVEASPAAAAEVEARTGEWAGLTRLFWAGSEGLSEDAIRATLAVQRPPRAGLPSRDEVAAFLEWRWPKGWRVNVRDVRIYK